MNRTLIYTFSAALVLAMLSPLAQHPSTDGFPLSNYPMFSAPRTSRSTIHTILGVTGKGELEPLSPKLITGAGWPTLAVERTTKSLREPEELCVAVAARVGGDRRRGDRYVEVVYVTEVYDSARFFSGDEEPASRKEHVRCPVPG